MGYTEKLLTQDERIVLVARQNWTELGRRIVGNIPWLVLVLGLPYLVQLLARQGSSMVYLALIPWIMVFTWLTMRHFLPWLAGVITPYLAVPVGAVLAAALAYLGLVLGVNAYLLVAVIPAVLLCAATVRRCLEWWNRQYVITNRRVMKIVGVLNKKTFDWSLEKINDLELTQRLFGRLLGYGDLTILTAASAAEDIGGSSIGEEAEEQDSARRGCARRTLRSRLFVGKKKLGIVEMSTRLDKINNPVYFKTVMLTQKEALGIDMEDLLARQQAQDSAPTATSDIPQMLAELEDLCRRGILSPEEFEQKKQQLLSRL